MPITITLPTNEINLKSGRFDDDVASQIQTHNLNMQELQTVLRAFQIAIQTIADNASTSSGSITVASDKREVRIPVDLADGENVTDANGFNVSRIGVPSGGTANELEYVITDTDTDRNTNFSTAIFNTKQLNGPIVYPTLIPNLTTLRVIFAHNAEMAATASHTGPVSTDPNTKIITFI